MKEAFAAQKQERVFHGKRIMASGNGSRVQDHEVVVTQTLAGATVRSSTSSDQTLRKSKNASQLPRQHAVLAREEKKIM